MGFIKQNWITGLAVLLGLFLLFLAVAIGVENDPETSGAERAFGVIVDALLGLSLLGGLWLLRRDLVSTRVALGAVVLGLIGGVSWFWMIIPLLAALVVFWLGVVKGGLIRESTTA